MVRIVPEWLREHVELPPHVSAAQLAADFVKVGIEEEAIIPAAVTGPLVVGRVLEFTPEPQKNNKVINWCRVDVGPEHNGPEGSRGIVCGAHNFQAGDLVVVALPGTVLPGPFPINARKTYGHISDGMICSIAELGLGEDADGIIVLPGGLVDPGAKLEPGQDAKALLGLDTEVLDVNVTPDRGYEFSYRGLAREYSHATGARFNDPGLATNLPPASDRGFHVEVDDAAPIHGQVGCDRFVTRIVRGINPIAPSPAWLQRRLEGAGMRSISLAVDITNYVMLDLGQPLHAYDLHQVAEPIVVRRAEPGERLTTLDDVVRKLDPEDLLITDSPDGQRGSRILGLAGVMGGASSEVTAGTTDVLIEAAHFDPVSVARTARRQKIPSEAAKRFERGVDPKLPPVAAQRVVDLLVQLGGGVADEAVTDLNTTTSPKQIEFPVQLPSRIVGVDYTPTQVRDVLTEIGCELTETGKPDIVQVTPPSWRPDLTEPVDLVEEVARISGYEQIPSVLPLTPGGAGLTREQRLVRSIARSLAESGLIEILSYPFVGDADYDALGISADDPRRNGLKLANPLADDQPQLRTNLLVSLLDTARRNVARGLNDFGIFEIGLVTEPRSTTSVAPNLPVAQLPTGAQLDALAAAIPDQPRHVGAVLVGRLESPGWWGKGRVADWTDAIALANQVAERSGVALVAEPEANTMPWHPGRCARLHVDGIQVGHAGELNPKAIERFDLPPRSVALELDITALLAASAGEPVVATSISAFPVAKEDFAFVVPEAVLAQALRKAIATGAGELAEDIVLFDLYTGDQVPAGHKSLAFGVRLRAGDRTLSADEVKAAREGIVHAAGELGAELGRG